MSLLRGPSSRRLLVALGTLAGLIAVGRAEPAPEPCWAYGYPDPPAPGEKAVVPPLAATLQDRLIPEPGPGFTVPGHVAGSAATYSRRQIRDWSNVVDWFPGDHPPMPAIMAHGPASRGPISVGCAYCHLPNGRGRPENAPVAGLSVRYILLQLGDFRKGNRVSADPRKPNTNLMAQLAREMSDDEMKASAAYFASLKWTPWTRVVETALVPRTRIEGNLFLATGAERTEPIAGRIIEVPENEEQSEHWRNPRSGFVAYVPVGSVRAGEILVTTGGAHPENGRLVPGRTLACTSCHGPDLMGIADVPGLAGRSPSYLVRQLYDLQRGTRHGASAVPMGPVVANLTDDDMVAIAAYVASRRTP